MGKLSREWIFYQIGSLVEKTVRVESLHLNMMTEKTDKSNARFHPVIPNESEESRVTCVRSRFLEIPRYHGDLPLALPAQVYSAQPGLDVVAL